MSHLHGSPCKMLKSSLQNVKKSSQRAAENWLQHLNADVLILMFFICGQWNKTNPAVNSSREFWQRQREADVADHVSDT